MTPFFRFLRRLLERLLDRWAEGPEPPERIADMAFDFANEHPHATRAEWLAFAAAHAAECYRTGWVRGAEHAERVPELWLPDPSPEEVADAHDPDWRRSEPVLLNAHELVREESDEVALMKEQIRRLAPPWMGGSGRL